ncbi:hypothetical protein DFH06DRAFT_1302125 [Mycena polygramma]|nr:hypothetical protein DFH06DRAFT_1302125 [Mycena polygramma]
MSTACRRKCGSVCISASFAKRQQRPLASARAAEPHLHAPLLAREISCTPAALVHPPPFARVTFGRARPTKRDGGDARWVRGELLQRPPLRASPRARCRDTPDAPYFHARDSAHPSPLPRAALGSQNLTVATFSWFHFSRCDGSGGSGELCVADVAASAGGDRWLQQPLPAGDRGSAAAACKRTASFEGTRCARGLSTHHDVLEMKIFSLRGIRTRKEEGTCRNSDVLDEEKAIGMSPHGGRTREEGRLQGWRLSGFGAVKIATKWRIRKIRAWKTPR